MAVKIEKFEIVVDNEKEFNQVLSAMNSQRQPSREVEERVKSLKGLSISGRYI